MNTTALVPGSAREMATLEREAHEPAAGRGLDFSGMVQFAGMMARSNLVPEHLRGKPEDCLLIVEQAARWGMSPFAVAQCTSVLHGKLMFEGKLVAAAVNGSGILSGRLAYDYSGEGEARAVVVHGTVRGEHEPRAVVVRLKDARTRNEWWTKQPDQQLAYHGARVWARRHAPEVMLGVYSPEEFPEEPAKRAPAHANEADSTGRFSYGPNPDDEPSAVPGEAPAGNVDAGEGHALAEELRCRIEGCASVDAVSDLMTSAEITQALFALKPTVRAAIRDAAKARMLALGWESKKDKANAASADGEKPKDGPLAHEAGMRCGVARFQQFLAEQFNRQVVDAMDARAVICEHCGVTNRAELDHNPGAAEIFRNLMRAFEAWKA